HLLARVRATRWEGGRPGAAGEMRGDGIRNPVLQRRLDQRHPRAIVMVALLLVTGVAAEQDGFPGGSLSPSDRGRVYCRHRRKVRGLGLGLHGPSVVAQRAQTACGAPSVSAPMIIFFVFQELPRAGSEPSQVGSITVWSMPLFTRKQTHEPQHGGPGLDPLPGPPEPDRGQLRSMQAHRQYLLSCVNPLRPFRQSLLDAVGLNI